MLDINDIFFVARQYLMSLNVSILVGQNHRFHPQHKANPTPEMQIFMQIYKTLSTFALFYWRMNTFFLAGDKMFNNTHWYLRG
jgi:hypothetical protein